MSFYDLSKQEREELVREIYQDITGDFSKNKTVHIIRYFSDEDTYVRKAAYLATGRIYRENITLRIVIVEILKGLLCSNTDHVRQTSVNAAGEIGITDFGVVENIFDTGLLDHHHSVRNAVIGSIKKMAEKNPRPILKWSEQYIIHPDSEIRREICHGLELRGRTHPQEILPMLKQLQYDKSARVRNTLIHVLGQIAYKKGCLETVINDLNKWENRELIEQALIEIISVHERYKNFAALTQQETIDYINRNYKR